MPPRKRNKFTSPQHVKDTVTGAYSTTYNPRNLEEPLYTPFRDTMDKVIQFTPPSGSLSARQQHNLWRAKEVVDIDYLPMQEAKAVYPDGYSDDEDSECGIGARVAKRRRLGEALAQSVQRALASFETLSGPPKTTGLEVLTDLVGLTGLKDLKDLAGLTGLTGLKNPTSLASLADLASLAGLAGLATSLACLKSLTGLTGLAGLAGPAYLACLALTVLKFDQDSPVNISTVTAATIPGGRDSLPDVVICHTCVVDMEEPTDPNAHIAWEARLGKKVSHQCIPAIAEIKRAPSRAFRGDKLSVARSQALRTAITDVAYCLSVQFERDPYAQLLIAIVAAGAWWQWRTFKRAEVPPTRFWDEKAVSPPLSQEEKYWRSLEYKILTKFSKAPITYLGTMQSDQEWDKLQQTALIPILEAHASHYP
ncbi:hypothetical protein EVG20_g11240 [Dentipellis fragilis]|uniref:Uncharacterized protein n=1 Tax=Dentipellis fragilis TaxID=205917 RepID=A0A4Y9XNL2_9AGAM|nr:hypothetical protein EVG20_g11240 [Dentipellis fragilis]